MTSYLKLPWIEKYRPNNLDEVIDEGDKVSLLKGLIERGELPHLLFYGPPGTGKTSLILALARQVYGDSFRNKYVLELNASDDRGIDTVRRQIPEFVKTSTNKPKLIILDEADALTGDAQGALRRVIEQYSKHCRFCLICNNIYKIIGGLKSRCVVIRFGRLPDLNIKEKLSKIIELEGVRISEETIDFILKSCGDFRQVLNILQLEHTLKSTLEGENYTEIQVEEICRYLGIPDDKQFTDIVYQLTHGRLRENVARLKSDHARNLYSLVELVKMLTLWAVEQRSLTIGQKKKIIESLSEIDYRLKNSMGESDIQLYALASIFLGLGQIITKSNGNTTNSGQITATAASSKQITASVPSSTTITSHCSSTGDSVSGTPVPTTKTLVRKTVKPKAKAKVS